MIYSYIVVHYGEIGLKGSNRPFFEKTLINNIRKALKNLKYKTVKKAYGRVLVELDKNSNVKNINEVLQKVFGIQNFSPAILAKLDVNDINKKTIELIKNDKADTFKISAKRSNKSFKTGSQELNNLLGKEVVDKTGKTVKMKNPALTIFVELTEKGAFIFTEKIQGLGGLPIGVTGKLVAMLSGGIDSPVACFNMMKRGCKIIFVHFYDSTKGSAVKSKVEDLVKILNKYQFKSKLYMIKFEKVQTEIIKLIPSKYRMIVYRRVMFRIADKVLKEERAKGFITGDSLAQVASQTLENINVIWNATSHKVFAPLIGSDKIEIINQSKDIQTYETSILPYNDCCSFLVSKHPETRSRLALIEELEKNLDVEEEVKEAVKNSELIKF